MEAKKYTFWNLLSEYKILIPIIQRDYAQGRTEEYGKREKFLNKIHNDLVENKSWTMDFVYGRTVEDKFYPIDGQQRLTTLFLLYLYLFIKEYNEKSITEDEKKTYRSILGKFHYESRANSEDFCSYLISSNFVLPSISEKNGLIDYITNMAWFRTEWLHDSTVVSMLNMFQTIHEKFYQEKITITSLMATELISFYFLDLGQEDFDLTDELYIKMNARGKQLTNFENFKATFIDFLSKKYPNSIKEKPYMNYKGYFSSKIETDWTDLFWSYREDDETVLDNKFIYFFENIAMLCYFKDNLNKHKTDFSFSLNEEIFSSEENLLFLFDSLDWLYSMCEKKYNGEIDNSKLKGYFEKVFGKQNCRLFRTQEATDLFDAVITTPAKNIELKDIVLFYYLLKYSIKNSLSEPTKELINYLRVIRNLLTAKRFRKQTKFTPDCTFEEMGYYFKLFDTLSGDNAVLKNLDYVEESRISKVSFEAEKQKAKLIDEGKVALVDVYSVENQDCFQALIHNLKIEDNAERLHDYAVAINEIWNTDVSESVICRALIAEGFKGVYVQSCKLGETYYYGKNENWSYILTYSYAKDKNNGTQNNVQLALHELLKDYLNNNQSTPEKKLLAIIDSKSNSYTSDDWQYYFLKYESFTSLRLNYTVYKNTYEWSSLGSDSGNPLVAYHINLFVNEVCKQIGNKDLCDPSLCYALYSNVSPLYVNGYGSLLSTEKGWKLDSFEDKYLLNQHIYHENGVKYLIPGEGEDRISCAVNFIRSLK